MRYRRANRSRKKIILGGLCQMTGWHRDHARKALRRALEPTVVRPRRPRPPVYADEVIAALRTVWAVMDAPAGSRLSRQDQSPLPSGLDSSGWCDTATCLRCHARPGFLHGNHPGVGFSTPSCSQTARFCPYVGISAPSRSVLQAQDHRCREPDRMARRLPADRAPGTTAYRRADALHRRRRSPLHRVPHDTTDSGQLADLEARHRCNARVEDRIRAAKATGLRNLPCRGELGSPCYGDSSLTSVHQRGDYRCIRERDVRPPWWELPRSSGPGRPVPSPPSRGLRLAIPAPRFHWSDPPPRSLPSASEARRQA